MLASGHVTCFGQWKGSRRVCDVLFLFLRPLVSGCKWWRVWSPLPGARTVRFTAPSHPRVDVEHK